MSGTDTIADDPRLAAFRSRTRTQAGRGSFFWSRPAHVAVEGDARRVLRRRRRRSLVMTTLGLCIACLWDWRAPASGMNHFMLPEASAPPSNWRPGWLLRVVRDGLLINDAGPGRGARAALEARCSAAADRRRHAHTLDVGERNTRSCSTTCRPAYPGRHSDVRGNRPLECASCRRAARR